MPDKHGFDHLPNWGAVTVQCTEIDCNAGGPIWQWPQEEREKHFLSHQQSVIVSDQNSNNGIIFTGNLRHGICRDCGDDFYQVRRRGRPALSCEKCRGMETE